MVFRTGMALLLLLTGANAQVERLWKTGQWIFSAKKLYVGADFIYPNVIPAPSILVTLMGNAASNRGDLYIINKRTGTTTYLFRNTDPPVIRDVTALFTPGDTVIFKYVAIDGSANDKLPKYSGRNNNPASPYYSPVSSDTHIDSTFRFGHRWCVTGPSVTFPGELEFGFEDYTDDGVADPVWATDMDFDDIVYRVSGLQMRIMTKRNVVW